MIRLVALLFLLSSYSLANANVKIFVEELWPLGFSDKGAFAYIKKSSDDSKNCYWYFAVIDLVTDNKLVSRMDDMKSCSAEFDINTFSSQGSQSFIQYINDAIIKHRITKLTTSFDEFPLLTDQGLFDVVIKNYDLDFSSGVEKIVKRVLAVKGNKIKVISVIQDSSENGSLKSHSHEILGYIRSPYEDRVAVILRYIYMNNNNSLIYKLDILGSSLNFR